MISVISRVLPRDDVQVWLPRYLEPLRLVRSSTIPATPILWMRTSTPHDNTYRGLCRRIGDHTHPGESWMYVGMFDDSHYYLEIKET